MLSVVIKIRICVRVIIWIVFYKHHLWNYIFFGITCQPNCTRLDLLIFLLLDHKLTPLVFIWSWIKFLVYMHANQQYRFPLLSKCSSKFFMILMLSFPRSGWVEGLQVPHHSFLVCLASEHKKEWPCLHLSAHYARNLHPSFRSQNASDQA